MDDDRDAVCWRHLADVFGRRHTSEDGGLQVVVGQAFTGEERTAAVGELDDHRRVDGAGCLEDRVDRVCADAVNGGQGEALGLGNSVDLADRVARNHARSGYRGYGFRSVTDRCFMGHCSLLASSFPASR